MTITQPINTSLAIARGWIKPAPPQEDGYKVWHREYTRKRMNRWRLEHPEEYRESQEREYARRKLFRKTGSRV